MRHLNLNKMNHDLTRNLKRSSLLLAVIFSSAFLLVLQARSAHPSEYTRQIEELLDQYENAPDLKPDENQVTADEIAADDAEMSLDTFEKQPESSSIVSSMDANKTITFKDMKTKETNELEGLTDQDFIDVLQLKDVDIKDVLRLISQKANLNIIAGNDISGSVTIYLKDVSLADALKIILDSNKLAYKVENKIVRVMTAVEFEQRYGYPFGGNIQSSMVRLSYVTAANMLNVLNQIKSSTGKIISDPSTNMLVLMDSVDRIEMMKQVIRGVDVPVKTKVFEINYAQAKELSDSFKDLLTENLGQAKFDERSNQLIVTDTPEKIDMISQYIKAIDKGEQQVLIEAKIIQVALSDQEKFGVDWETIVDGYHSLDIKSNFDILASTDKRGEIGIGTLSADRYNVVLHALETDQVSNILSSPSIISLNNQEAKILVGSTEPYVTTTTTTPSSGPTTTAESVNFIDVGVKLFVTPMIHKDDFITMKIRPEVSTVTRTLTTSNNNTIPVVETSEAETNVRVKHGVTIVIGGLIKDEKITTTNKVPLLGDVPIVGSMFRSKDDLMRKTEIVIFLTPWIITGDVSDKRKLDTFVGLPVSD